MEVEFGGEIGRGIAAELSAGFAGALDPGLKFYLMSRGITDAEAEALLIQAFIGETVEEIAHEGIREALMNAAIAWLRARAA